MNTMSTATITPAEAAKLWYDAIDGAYSDTPNDETTRCGNCYRTYSKHDGLACPRNGNDDDNVGYEFLGDAEDYLTPAMREGGVIEPKLIAAYEATKHIPYANLPDYDDSDIHNPLHVIAYLPYTEWLDSLGEACEWLEGWRDCTDALTAKEPADNSSTPDLFSPMRPDARRDQCVTILNDPNATFVEKSRARRGLEIVKANNNYDLLAAFKALDGYPENSREWAVCRELVELRQQQGRQNEAALKGY